MTLDDFFPETIFVKQYKEKYGQDKAVTKQLGVVAGEMLEVQDAYSRGHYNHAMEELVDVMNAAHNAMRLIPGYTPEKIHVMVREVINKNVDRGYYDNDNS